MAQGTLIVSSQPRGGFHIVADRPARYNPPACRISRAHDEVLREAFKGGTSTALLRIGIGHDTHRLGDGGPLRIGGVTIPFDRHLIGHSDADVLLHAITDALLGAAALGDIGELFPDTDELNRHRDSAEMLRLAWQQVQRQGYQIANLDCIVFAQRPKLGPHKMAIRAAIAGILAIDVSQVGLQAKTGEAVGPVGREEALMAECVVLLVAPPPG